MPPSTMPQKTNKAGLRGFALYSFPVGFVFLLAHGIASGDAFPALGLMPMSLSALLSGLILFRDKLAASGSPVQNLSSANILFADLALALFHIGMLIPSWVVMSDAYRQVIALGAYCTVFMMVDFAIHAYFGVTQLIHLIVARNCNCDHCRAVSKLDVPSFIVSGYTPLNDGDSEPEDIGRDVEAGSVRL